MIINTSKNFSFATVGSESRNFTLNARRLESQLNMRSLKTSPEIQKFPYFNKIIKGWILIYYGQVVSNVPTQNKHTRNKHISKN